MPVIAPQRARYPDPVYPVVVQVKRAWSEPWQTVPDARFVQAACHTAAAGTDSAVIERPFGWLKHPWESALSNHAPIALDGYWLRLIAVSDQGYSPFWLGRIAGEPRAVQGSVEVPTGTQQWQAYGPQRILEKIHLSKAWFAGDDRDDQLVGWLPPLNDRDQRNNQTGNRSTDVGDESRYVYGGTEVWNHYDYLNYLLHYFATSDDGPYWEVGGQMDLLLKLQETIQWGTSPTLASMFRELIPPRLGMDYVIRPTDDGFFDRHLRVEFEGIPLRRRHVAAQPEHGRAAHRPDPRQRRDPGRIHGRRFLQNDSRRRP